MDNELFPIVDVNGNIIGSATRKECHSGSMLLHPVVHLHVFRNDGAIYLQKRSMNKDIQPGKWDTAVGGHVDLGESVYIAVKREAKEELGIDVDAPKYLCSYTFQSPIEHELVNVFCIYVDDDFSPVLSSDEIDEGRFWSETEINKSIGNGVLTPNFEQEYNRIKEYINK
ncbi:MAG: NUDIX domain-containing protein [Muribaculaceae bacterium]|nr:NUDIX domain-containing protein [Muribaculaceae bacterium]